MVTLIATAHKECLVNSNELYKIIEQIKPEVIFEEIPPSLFASVYDGSRNDSLETLAIKKYLQNCSLTQFPVDLDTDNITRRRFKNDYREMVSIFSDNSNDYNYLSYQFNVFIESEGFQYLNSDECSELLARKNSLEEEITRNLKLEKLSLAYNNWLDFIDKRRNQMIHSIYTYSNLNRYDKGLFLVGAEHRGPIMAKVREFEKNNEQHLNWNFSYFDI